VKNGFHLYIGQEHQRVNNVFQQHTDCVSSGGNIFSICYSTGEFFLHFVKVSITVNIFVISFTNS
jgi:hypothetical protein